MELALRCPASSGEYRVFNQFVETFSVNELGEKVRDVGRQMGIDVRIEHIINPRREQEEHYHNPSHTGLQSLGLKPNYLTDSVLADMFKTIMKYKDNIQEKHILPRITWS